MFWRVCVRALAAPGVGAVAVALALCGGMPAAAEPLEQERCAALAAELALLEGGGAGESILRGPEWAKNNLTPEQINYVRRLITVREDLLFRCRNFEVVRDPPPPSVAPADAPVPSRKPALPAAAKSDGMPLPARPERAAGPGADNTARKPADAGQAVKPALRGTLPVPAKNASQTAPLPQRKAPPTPQGAGSN